MSYLVETITLDEFLRLGLPEDISIPPPAAGAQFTLKPQRNEAFLVLSVHMHLTTSAAAGDRRPRIILARQQDDTVITFSVARNVMSGNDALTRWSFAVNHSDFIPTNYRSEPLAYPLIVTPSRYIGSDCEVFDGDDQWDEIVVSMLRLQETVSMYE